VRTLRWSLLAVLALAIAAGGAWAWLFHTQPGARWAWARAEGVTNGALTAAVVEGSIGGGLVVRDLRYAAGNLQVAAGRADLTLDVDLRPFRVRVLSASFLDVGVEFLESRAAGTDPAGPMGVGDVFASLTLPFELAISHLDLRRGRIAGLTDPAIDIDYLSLAGVWHEDLSIDDLVLETPVARVDGRGGIGLDRSATVDADLDVELAPRATGLADPLALSVRATGPLDSLVVDLRSAEPAVVVRGNVEGLAQGRLRWDLDARARDFVAPAGSGLPELPPLDVTASGNGGLDRFDVEAAVDVVGSAAQVELVAAFDTAEQRIDGELRWSALSWPVDADRPRLASEAGNVTVAGSLDDWRLRGDVAFATPDLPPGTFRVDGTGNRDSANVEIIDGQILGGTIAGRVAYGWQGARPIEATLELEAVQTEPLLPDWPAVVSGGLDLAGQLEPRDLRIALRNVGGTFRGKPLDANGGLVIGENALSFSSLALRHGGSSAELDGDLYAADGLDFRLAVDRIGDYVDAAGGSISASGNVSAAGPVPRLRLDARSDLLRYRDIEVDGLVIEDNDAADRVFAADVSAARLFVADQVVDAVDVSIDASAAEQRIRVDASAGEIEAGFTLTGALDEWRWPTIWRGAVSDLSADYAEIAVTQDAPATVVLSPDDLDLGELCVVEERGGTLCAAAAWRKGGQTGLQASVAALPVALVNDFVATGAGFDQLVTGRIDWRRDADGEATGRAAFDIAPGTVGSKDRGELKMATGAGRLVFELVGDQRLSGTVDLPLSGIGQVDAELELSRLDAGDAGLSGRLDLDVPRVALLAAFSPLVDDAAGSLRADLDLAGTVRSPLVSGRARFEDGRIRYLPLGLVLDDIDLVASLEERGEIELEGSLRAGEGKARIYTRADHEQTRVHGLELRIEGDNLTLIDVSDIRAVADTDIGITYDGTILDLDGRIEFPSARITPRNLGVTRISESEDVVLVGREMPAGTTTASGSSRLAVTGELDVALGNDVVIRLDAAQARVSGSTRFRWAGGLLPLAEGAFQLNGEIQSYGQTLSITDGTISFPNVPADDPLLRIRAERDIYGNSEVRRAGVLVSGTAKSPEIEPYTDPPTTEERAVTLLLTGSDFDYEQGIGAVDFGTYIAPRVYASYGIGLFDQDNVIRIRYDLKRGFGITATSGERDSGVDLSYRFEN